MRHHLLPLGEQVPAILGVGYEGTSLVADVRLNSVSRIPGMSKTALRNALEASGIGYRHLRSLGDPKANRTGFAKPEPGRQAAVTRYCRILDQPESRAALDELRALSQTRRVALLCVESDPAACHRQVILTHLAEG